MEGVLAVVCSESRRIYDVCLEVYMMRRPVMWRVALVKRRAWTATRPERRALANLQFRWSTATSLVAGRSTAAR